MENTDGRVCLVTGGARGIGAATARRAGAAGYAVCINYRTARAEAEALAAALIRDGGTAIAVCADVGREDEVAALFATVDRELGPLTALVNNAGDPGDRRPVIAVDPDMLRRVLDTNLVGTFLCTQQAVRRMARSGGGSGGAIVNLSSIVTRSGGSQLAAYAAAKAGVEGLTRALSRELAAEGIRVNAVSPGVIATDQQPLADTAWLERSRATIPAGRLGLPSEVAEVILWLLSDQASYVTGAIVAVAGGR